MPAKVRGQFCAVVCLFAVLHGFLRLNSGCQAVQHLPFLAKPSCQIYPVLSGGRSPREKLCPAALSLQNCNARLGPLPLIQDSLHSLVLLQLLIVLLQHAPVASCPSAGPTKAGVGEFWLPGKQYPLPVWWHQCWQADNSLSFLSYFYILWVSCGDPIQPPGSPGWKLMGRELSSGQETPWPFLSWSLRQWNSRLSFGEVEGGVNGKPSARPITEPG